MTRCERKPTPSRGGCERHHGHSIHRRRPAASQTFSGSETVCRGTQDGENVAVDWSQPIGRKAYHSVPARASTRPARAVKTQSCADLGRATSVVARQVDGPARGLGSTEGLRPLVVDTARRPVGGRTRQTPHGANPVPANQSTHEGKIATGCGITGMPTASGIPRPNPWEEVKEGSTSFRLGIFEDRAVVSSAGRRPRNRRGLSTVSRVVSESSLVVFAPPRW